MISMMLMDDDDVDDDDDDDYDDDLAAFQNDYYHARSKMTIITRSKTTPSLQKMDSWEHEQPQ